MLPPSRLTEARGIVAPMSKRSDALRLLRDLVAFARAERVWWMVPLVLALLAVAGLLVASQAAAPLLYTLF